MVNREQLTAGGLRAYELGRLRTAARAVVYLVPIALLCAFETGARETCTCLGVLLLGAAVFLRWRSRAGVENVTTGLIAGSVPLFVGLVVARVAPACASAPPFSLCTAVCPAVGVAAGVWLGLQTTRRRTGILSWAIAPGIATIAASLGCIGLGLPAVVGVGGGLVVGSGMGALTAKATEA